MIVLKPIGAVKVGNSVSRLTVGKKVPADVLGFWEKSGQLEGLKKGGAIGEKLPEKKEVSEKDKSGSLNFSDKEKAEEKK